MLASADALYMYALAIRHVYTQHGASQVVNGTIIREHSSQLMFDGVIDNNNKLINFVLQD
jgi:hypothetical protein